MLVYLIIIVLLILIFLFSEYLYSLLTFISLRLEGKEPDFQILNSLRDDLIHERKKKVASLEMILSTWERGESISTHLAYFKDLIGQLESLLKDQRRNLLLISSLLVDVRLNHLLAGVRKNLARIEKDKGKILELKNKLDIFSNEIERVLDEATQRFTFSLNEVIKEAVKIVRTEKDGTLREKQISIEERYEDIGERFRLPYKSYKDWQKLISNLIRNGVEAVETKLQATSYQLPVWVRVVVTGKDDEVMVEIEDNGVGMDEKTKESFYKRGFTKGKDTGLGLGITEETVEFIKRYGDWNVENKINQGTRIQIKINKEKAKEQDLEVEEGKALVIKLRSWRSSLSILGGLILILLLILYFQFNKYARFWEDWNPASAEVEENKLLIIYNKSGEELWRRRFIREIHFTTELAPGTNALIIKHAIEFNDVNSDGKNEIFVGFKETESKTGYILCLDFEGNELWRFNVGRSGIYETGGDIYTPAHKIYIEDVDQDGEKEVIESANCKTWFPCQIFVLNKDGKLEGEYWHSGHIEIVFIKDIDKDGEMEIVCGGINNFLENGNAAPILFILDGRNVKGQSPPYFSKVLPKAHEEVYIKIPRIIDPEKKIGMYPHAGIYYDGKREGYDQYAVTVTDYKELKRQYFVDQNLNFINLILSGRFYDEWSKLRQRGLIDFDITPEVIEKWKKFERWEKGVRVE